MRYRSDMSRFLVLAAALAVVAGACVQPGPPSVAIDKLEANLVFGVKPVEEPTKPPAQQAVERAVAPEEPPPLEFETIAPEDDDFEFTLEEKPDPCPAAPITAAPEVATEVDITGDPPEGLYRWQYSVRVVVEEEGEEEILTDSGFERRMVRNFEEVSDTVYEFETVQPAGDSGNFIVTTFRVDTEAINAGDPTAGAGVVESPVRPGEPERGVTITKIETRDRNDDPVGLAFEPTTGILMLPLPVTSGEQYQSVAVDPKGATVVHDATVTRRARVDACGDLVDGWLVEATQAIANPGVTEAVEAGSYRYSYIIATQYGGMPVNERIQPAAEDDDSFDIEFILGQLEPDPLPEPTEEP